MPTHTETTANSRPPADVLGTHPSTYRAEPSPSLIVAALGRYKWLVLGLTVALTICGLAIGYKRKPIYTANATVQVGQVNPNSPGFYGFVQSATELATTFSRAITANGVLSIIQHKTGLTPAQSSARLSATPIPDGAAFSVIATGSTSQSAVSLANTAAAAMVTYEAAANSSASTTSSNTAAIFNEYRGQSTQLAHDKAIVQKLQNNSSSNGSSPDPTNHALVQAQANAGLAQGRANALAAAYTQALENQQPPWTMLSPLASALTASSDRKHKLELLAFVGLAAGLLIGSAIAVMLEQRRVRRTAAH
jgi:capsular polysaccharide biosynthesis protein